MMQIEKLRAILGDPKGMLSNLPGLPLPLDPTVRVRSILPGEHDDYSTPIPSWLTTIS